MACSLGAYVYLGYFVPGTDFYTLISPVLFLFIAYVPLYRSATTRHETKTLILFSFIARMALLFMLPNFSDDYFRFVWDGRLLADGINPYSVLPADHIRGGETTGSMQELFAGMNSKNYYSVYPPLLQYVFCLSALLFPHSIYGSVIGMRCIIILAEAGNVRLIQKLLRKFNLPEKNVLLYAMNPLIITELTGNLHFEAVMIFFLLAAIFLLAENKFFASAVLFSLSVATKMIPLLFLPLLCRRIGLKKTFFYATIILLSLLLLFLPFAGGEAAVHLGRGLLLYFQKFEFNASVYYLARWLGYQLAGYNTIAVAAPLLSLAGALLILFIAFREKERAWEKFFHAALFSICTYYFFATVVHPWYLSLPVFFAVFVPWRFPLLWSGLIFLSYAAYMTPAYKENLWFVAAEYMAVVLFFAWESHPARFKVLRTFLQKCSSCHRR